ncbi:hypothetical protein DM02DRAFT_618897 [Periconia macrospinosa]|uniref:Uncharacterized protein n=1 Tax=Periconia macrospinosa TaxID=97972 RepID=A0A2V1D7D0_9PLEO|nr:hypothetical protein DM02DRAFT_618897 [Periconia macrospinosa]
MSHSDDFDPEYDNGIENWPLDNLPVLPPLSPHPAVLSGCCVALSSRLLSNLSTVLPPAPSLVLSIGSGSGLLEGLLRADPYNIHILGVEVQPSVNRYLSVAHHRTVTGTYSLEPLASESEAWMFIYPRRVGLIQAYISMYEDSAVSKILWIGPAADWDDYKVCFGNRWNVKVQNADEIGGREWELVVVASKKTV